MKKIYDVPPANPANYAYEDRLRKLRKLFFVDLPEQTGDTPPTAAQWYDEMARAQRRIGVPGLSFWREGPSKIFLRFQHLLEQAGMIKPLRVDGRAVATLPRNPAQAAAEMQEVATAVKYLSITGPAFPEEYKLRIDGGETMKNLKNKMRADLIAFRDEDKVNTALDQIQKLAGGATPSPDGSAAPQPPQ